MKKISPVLVLCLLASWSVASQATIETSKCVMCHNGVAAPKFNTLTPAQFKERLTAIRDKKVPSKVMAVMAKGLSDDDIADLADLLAKKE